MQGKRYVRIVLNSLVISVILGPVATCLTMQVNPFVYPKDTVSSVQYLGFPFAWLRQTNHYLASGPKNEIMWLGFALSTLFWVSVLFTPLVVITPLLRKKGRCPVCGTTSIEKNPNEWITSPGWGSFNPPMTFTSRYKYRCRKCQHEWNE